MKYFYYRNEIPFFVWFSRSLAIFIPPCSPGCNRRAIQQTPTWRYLPVTSLSAGAPPSTTRVCRAQSCRNRATQHQYCPLRPPRPRLATLQPFSMSPPRHWTAIIFPLRHAPPRPLASKRPARPTARALGIRQAAAAPHRFATDRVSDRRRLSTKQLQRQRCRSLQRLSRGSPRPVVAIWMLCDVTESCSLALIWAAEQR